MVSESKHALPATLLCLLLLGTAGAPGFAADPLRPGAAKAEDTLQRVAACLVADSPTTPELIADRLVQLGTSHMLAMFDTFRRGELANARAADPRGLVLSDAQREGLLAAMKRMPNAWRACLQQIAAAQPALSARSAATRVVGEIGEGSDLQLLIDLAHAPTAAPAAGSGAVPPSTEEAPVSDEDAVRFEQAVERILAREARALAQIETQFLIVDAQLQAHVVRAISNQKSLRGLELLARLLGARNELDQLLLTEISRTSVPLVPPFDPLILDPVRRFLDASSVDLVREAALAVGRLEDLVAVPTLISLLSHENRGVRQNAYWSLNKITGLSFAADPDAWELWLEQETTWWRERAPVLFSQLETGERALALASVQEIARRHHPRHPLAAELARALDHPESEVRRLTCVALGRFRSRSAVPNLLGCLNDPDAEVRAAAGGALTLLTGLDLPPVRAAWARAGY